MATYNDLAHFKNSELAVEAHSELDELSFLELFNMTNERLKEVETKGDKSNPTYKNMISLVKVLLPIAAVRITQDTTDFTWPKILKELIKLLNLLLH